MLTEDGKFGWPAVSVSSWIVSGASVETGIRLPQVVQV